MNSTCPVSVDAAGVRWGRVSSRMLTDRFPHLRSIRLAAEILAFADSDPNGDEYLSVLLSSESVGSVRTWYLRGDEHHANAFYDISPMLRDATDSPASRRELGMRLRGRSLVGLASVPTRVDWLSPDLTDAVLSFVPEDADGVVLASDLAPRDDPDGLSVPWGSPTERCWAELGSASEVVLPWVFASGEPTVRARLRLLRAVREATRVSLHRLRQALEPRQLGVELAIWRSSPWTPSAVSLTAQRVTPVLQDRASSHRGGRSTSRTVALYEGLTARLVGGVMRFHRDGAGPLAPAPLAAVAMGATEAVAPLEAQPIADVLVIAPRSNEWAHAEDGAGTDYRAWVGSAIRRLEDLGVPFIVADEPDAASLLDRARFRAVLVCPCRTVSRDTLGTLQTARKRGSVVVVCEPAPYLCDGERSGELERCLSRRWLRRVDLRDPADDARFAAALRRARTGPVVECYEPDTGNRVRPCRRLALIAATEAHVSIQIERASQGDVIAEFAGTGALDRWGSGRWETVDSWVADGSTFTWFRPDADTASAYRFHLEGSLGEEMKRLPLPAAQDKEV